MQDNRPGSRMAGAEERQHLWVAQVRQTAAEKPLKTGAQGSHMSGRRLPAGCLTQIPYRIRVQRCSSAWQGRAAVLQSLSVQSSHACPHEHSAMLLGRQG